MRLRGVWEVRGGGGTSFCRGQARVVIYIKHHQSASVMVIVRARARERERTRTRKPFYFFIFTRIEV